MTPWDLAMQCKKAIEEGSGYIVVELDRRAGGEDPIPLAGENSPLGELLCENSQTRAVARFDAIDVLAWLAANDLVRVEATTKDQVTDDGKETG